MSVYTNRLIIGSHAMKHWYGDFPREPKDLDIMDESPLMTKDVQHYWFGKASEKILKINKDSIYIDPNILYTLKISHLGWNIFWEKNMHDALFLKSKGCVADEKLYKSLVKFFITQHGKRWASLKGKDSTTFFEDAVPRKYNHDSIHEAIAVYDEPLYERLIVEGVTCGEDAFNLLSHEDKLNLVREEVWTTALERFLIPSNFTCGDTAAYSKSLKKLATTMSSGYFKFFILDNFQQLYKNNDKSYIERFKKAEQQNKLRTI
jgi:hypothetical protein